MTGVVHLLVLVVEDDPLQASLIRRSLERAGRGYQVRVVDSLDAFRMAADEQLPDVALVDLNLPDGRATEILTGEPEAGRFPILIMTAHGDEATAVSALRSGALDYVVKSDENIAGLPRIVERAMREWSLRIEKARTISALRESEARYRLFVEAANDGIWAMDSSFGTTFVNAKMCEMLGYTREEMLGRPVTDFMFPEDLAAHGVEMRRRENGEAGRYERRFRRRDGTPCHTTVSATALRHPDGSFGGSFATFADVTEQRRSEEHRRVLAELLDTCPASITVHDFDGNFLYANRRTLEYHGYERDEFMELNLNDLDVPESAALILPRIEQMIREGEAFFEVAHRRKDGTHIPLLVNGRVTEWQGRRVVLSVASDVTEQKQAEKELLSLKAAVEQAADGIALTDLDGSVQFVNRSWAGMHGCRPEDLLGSHLGVFHTPDQYRQEVVPFLDRLRLNGRQEAEVNHCRQDGRPFPTWMSATVLRDAHGHPVGMLAVARDITAQKNAALQLLRSREELKETNQRLERTAMRAREMARKAEAANSAKSDFLANMSHEIRTPLNGIVGMTELLLDSGLAGEPRRYAETVQSCSETLLRLINDLLDFAKIEAGKLDLESIPFDLHSALKEAIDILHPRAERKNLTLSVLIAPGVPARLRGDPGRLRQIILNLAGNAIKFTHEGGVTIAAEVVRADEQRTCLKISVQDTGIGIPEDRRGVLFEPFTQVDGSTTRRYGGTGLGLAIVRQLAGLMGGSVGVESCVGEGSTFWVTAVFERDIAPEPLQPADLRGSRVLVVDANPRFSAQLEEWLRGTGCRCDVIPSAATATTALRLAQSVQDPYAVVLVSEELPPGEMREIVRRLQDDPDTRSIPLVLIASAGIRGDSNQYRESGFSGYISRPFELDQLRDCLGLVLARSRDATEDAGIVTRHTVAEARRRSR